MCCQSPGKGWTSHLVTRPLMIECCSPPSSGLQCGHELEKQRIHQYGLSPTVSHFHSHFGPLSALGIPLPLPIPHFSPSFCTSLWPATRQYCRGFQVCLFLPLAVHLSEEIGQTERHMRIGCPRNPMSLPVLFSSARHSEGDFVPVGW